MHKKICGLVVSFCLLSTAFMTIPTGFGWGHGDPFDPFATSIDTYEDTFHYGSTDWFMEHIREGLIQLNQSWDWLIHLWDYVRIGAEATRNPDIQLRLNGVLVAGQDPLRTDLELRVSTDSTIQGNILTTINTIRTDLSNAITLEQWYLAAYYFGMLMAYNLYLGYPAYYTYLEVSWGETTERNYREMMYQLHSPYQTPNSTALFTIDTSSSYLTAYFETFTDDAINDLVAFLITPYLSETGFLTPIAQRPLYEWIRDTYIEITWAENRTEWQDAFSTDSLEDVNKNATFHAAHEELFQRIIVHTIYSLLPYEMEIPDELIHGDYGRITRTQLIQIILGIYAVIGIIVIVRIRKQRHARRIYPN